MQFRNIFLLLLTGLLLFAAAPALAQKITTNENGDKIILYPDGSWRYFDSNVDSEPQKPAANPDLEDQERQLLIKNYRIELIDAAERAVSEETLALRNYEDAQFDRVLVDEELEEVAKNSSATKSEINAIKLRLNEAEEKEKKALQNLNYATSTAKKAEEKTMLTDDEIYSLILANNNTVPSEDIAENVPEENIPTQSKSGEKLVFASFNPKDDVMMYPPEKKCNLAFDGVDDFSGKKRREVAKEILFSHTSEDMRPFFKDQDYMTCRAYLSSLSGGITYLSLEITIASESAQRDYGMIEKGSILNIKLMDESNAKLFNNKTDVGVLDELNNTVTYSAQYVINSGEEKVLRRNEIDKIRVIWSSGYEDYEVYNVDFFTNQFNCLKD